MLGAIPNPQKKITIDTPLATVKKGVEYIPVFYPKYRFVSSNPAFNLYTFDLLEFLSFGVYMDINLAAITDTRTEITIEVRRKIGAFDKTYEVQLANEHIAQVIDAIPRGFNITSEYAKSILEQNAKIKNKRGKKRYVTFIAVCVLALVALLFIVSKINNHNYRDASTEKIYKSLLTRHEYFVHVYDTCERNLEGKAMNYPAKQIAGWKMGEAISLDSATSINNEFTTMQNNAKDNDHKPSDESRTGMEVSVDHLKETIKKEKDLNKM